MSAEKTYFNNRKSAGRDDYETPEWVWELFFKHFKNREARVWAPFFCKGKCAEYIEKHHGKKYVHCDADFFEWVPPLGFDCIIDNPPYSCKKEVFERCLALGKPFALYVPLDTLGRCYISKLLNCPELQLLIPYKKTDFITDYDVNHTTPPHKTVWFCYKMELGDGRQIIFE